MRTTYNEVRLKQEDLFFKSFFDKLNKCLLKQEQLEFVKNELIKREKHFHSFDLHDCKFGKKVAIDYDDRFYDHFRTPGESQVRALLYEILGRWVHHNEIKEKIKEGVYFEVSLAAYRIKVLKAIISDLEASNDKSNLL